MSHRSIVARLLTLALLCAASTFIGCARDVAENTAPDLSLVKAARNKMSKGSGNVGPVESINYGEPTGWANITGTVTVNSAPPSPPPLAVKGSDCSDASTTSETIVWDSATKGLRDVLIYLDDQRFKEDDSESETPVWVHPSYSLSKNPLLQSKLYDQEKCRFENFVFTARTTQTITIKNSDPFGHNTAIKGNANSFDQTITPGNEVSYNPTGEEMVPIPVSCAIHPWMSGWMIIRDNPYAVTTDPTGKFTIKNIPAGAEGASDDKKVTLKFRMWQAAIGNVQKVTVNGAQETWPGGYFEVTLEAGKDVQMDIVIDASSF